MFAAFNEESDDERERQKLEEKKKKREKARKRKKHKSQAKQDSIRSIQALAFGKTAGNKKKSNGKRAPKKTQSRNTSAKVQKPKASIVKNEKMAQLTHVSARTEKNASGGKHDIDSEHDEARLLPVHAQLQQAEAQIEALKRRNRKLQNANDACLDILRSHFEWVGVAKDLFASSATEISFFDAKLAHLQKAMSPMNSPSHPRTQ